MTLLLSIFYKKNVESLPQILLGSLEINLAFLQNNNTLTFV